MREALQPSIEIQPLRRTCGAGEKRVLDDFARMFHLELETDRQASFSSPAAAKILSPTRKCGRLQMGSPSRREGERRVARTLASTGFGLALTTACGRTLSRSILRATVIRPASFRKS